MTGEDEEMRGRGKGGEESKGKDERREEEPD